MNARLAFRLAGVVAGALGIAVVTVAIALLDTWAPVLSLGALYVFVVLPVAVVWGMAYAIPVAVASMLAFNFFFLEPLYTFTLTDGQNWVALAVYLVSAVVVSQLAARARRRAAEAEQREHEAALLARVSATLLESVRVEEELRGIAADAARTLGLDAATDRARRPGRGRCGAHTATESGGPGRRSAVRRREGSASTRARPERVLPALATLLAAAVDRERLAQRALEVEALRRSDAAKTTILRSVSHDLRSPLTAIRAAAEALANPVVMLSEADEARLVETVAAETRRLSRLVDDLLDLSRLEAGASPPEPELWTVDDLVGRTLAEVGERADRVTVETTTSLQPVRVDAAQVTRVVANLIDNALKFSPADSVVELMATLEDDELTIRVLDRGPGLTDAELTRIFEPFEHGDAVANRGAGLGLAIARGFTQANGGIIWAERRPGGGSVFVVSLPVATAEVEALA